MPKVNYNTNDGYIEVRLVPIGLSISEYNKGILLGPPSIASLPLDHDTLISLNHALVEAGFLMWPDLSGQRHRLDEIVARRVEPEQRRDIKIKLLELYQQAYYAPDGEI